MVWSWDIYEEEDFYDKDNNMGWDGTDFLVSIKV